jgi:ketosteroid isomerase-like protein
MSQENVELVRRMTQVWNERGWQGVADDGLLHPEIEYHDDPAWPEARSAYGTRALVQRFDEVLEAIGQRGHTTVEQTVAHGAHVVLVVQLTGEGTASQIPYAHRWGFVCRVRDGQVDYIQAYLDAAEALDAIGLSG